MSVQPSRALLVCFSSAALACWLLAGAGIASGQQTDAPEKPAEVKPAEEKPAAEKPADAKPQETRRLRQNQKTRNRRKISLRSLRKRTAKSRSLRREKLNRKNLSRAKTRERKKPRKRKPRRSQLNAACQTWVQPRIPHYLANLGGFMICTARNLRKCRLVPPTSRRRAMRLCCSMVRTCRCGTTAVQPVKI